MNHKLRLFSRLRLAAALLAAPLLMAANGGSCAPAVVGTDAPDISGAWALTWQDDLEVDIDIGGQVYHRTLGSKGGVIEIEHDGKPLTFDLDCSRPDVVCPSEVWPTTVDLEQRSGESGRNVHVTVPVSSCQGELVDPDPASCGAGTGNETCEPVCSGDVVQEKKEVFGTLNSSGDHLTVALGGGVVTNGTNCALLALSTAEIDVETTGSGEAGDWKAVSFPSAKVVTGFAGGCLWAGDADGDGALEGIAVGAKLTLSTSFTGERL